MSIQVKKLEEELKLIIFDRNTNPISLTIEGKLIVKQAINIINEASQLFTIANETREIIAGDYHLAIIPSIMDSLLPLFLNDFITKYPLVDLHIHELKTSEMIYNLNNNIIDLGIAALPLREENIEEKSIYYEPFVGLVPFGHRMSKYKNLTEKNIKGQKLLLLSKGHCFRTQVLDFCKADIKLPKGFNFEGGNFQTLINLVESGKEMTILPELVANKIRHIKLQKMLKNFKGNIPVREVGFVYKKSYVKNKFRHELEKIIIKNLPEKLIKFQKKNVVVSPIKI